LTYDGDGRRVKKSSGKLYWYGMGSDPLDETDLTGNLTNEYIFFGRKRIARRDSSNNVFYYFADQLGTSRILVQSGQTGPCYDADFYPYGGERTPIVNSCPQNYKFTGKERDTETGLDNFGARHNASYLGRFMSLDAGGFGFNNPQSLNRYVYALNNPLRFIDPSGNEVVDIGTYFLATFTQKSQEIDPFAWILLLGSAVNGIRSRLWMKSVYYQQDSFVLPGAAHPAEGSVTGAWFSSSKSFWSMSVHFREDPGGGMTASIQFGLKPGGQFLSDPLKNGYYEWRLSNMPEKELTGFVFNLGSLTPEQLEALRNEAARQWRRGNSIDIRYLQILIAIEAEQRKREEEERKRRERCDALPAKCGTLQMTNAVEGPSDH
jgi:RHS repeat-associated protein